MSIDRFKAILYCWSDIEYPPSNPKISPSKMDKETKLRFQYLFERVGQALDRSTHGKGENEMMYLLPRSILGSEHRFNSMVNRRESTGKKSYSVADPTSIPDLSNIGSMCPRTSLYNYFNPNHRAATKELRQLLLDQDTEQLLSLACLCRDSELVNCKLWINAVSSALLFHPDTRNLALPAIWEVMPDQFFNYFALQQARREAERPQSDRRVVVIDVAQTLKSTNPESRLAYFREDIGINSHHWHWHLIYRLDDAPLQGRRKGELFYYMHHAMQARYDAERFANGLPQVVPLSIYKDPVVIEDGYFSKLVETTSSRNWGTRQNNTVLQDVDRQGDPDVPDSFRTVTLKQTREWLDRILEAIGRGTYTNPNNEEIPLDIDVLGDIVEASDLTPNPELYGAQGVHIFGHLLISYCHDPHYEHLENAGVMSENSTTMRDPVFFRWHQFVDDIFLLHKAQLAPYEPEGGEFPLSWKCIDIADISVESANPSVSEPNTLETFFMQSHVDLTRGIDFLKVEGNEQEPVWLRFSHLNHDAFRYNFTVINDSPADLRATVRIFIAPRFDETGERFDMTKQAKLFFEMDKFTENLVPGENKISRLSTDSTLTIPWDQTFRELEESLDIPAAQAICGCGWPQHMLLPRGNELGQIFDLVVFITNADEDSVSESKKCLKCREALSFCGRLGQPYPDKKPMGYPFDRKPFKSRVACEGDSPVQNLEEYVSHICNMDAVQVKIVHNPGRKEMRKDGGPENVQEISGM